MGTKTSPSARTRLSGARRNTQEGPGSGILHIRHLEDAVQTNKRPTQVGLYIHFGGAKGEEGRRRRRG